MTPPPPRRGVSPAVAAGAVGFAILMLGALGVQIVLLRAQLQTVRDQRGIAETQARNALPLIRALRPLADDVRGAAPATARLGRQAGRLMAQATPLARDLRAAQAGETLRGVSALTDALLRADVGGTTRALAGLIPRAVEATDDVAALRRAQAEALALQRDSLATQRETLSLLRVSLEIQRSTEAHAASIDRKTGGTAPPVALGG